ncbi:MAG: class I SAM-dependent methyltransferase [Acidobacteriota bacterium]
MREPALLEANRALWDRWTEVHERSSFYDVDAFSAGADSLCPVEIDEIGSQVAGRSLLHLQCHFGLDTLSWARRGARVTGVDLSPRAIETAQRLAREIAPQIPPEAGTPRFVACDLYDLRQHVDERFDIVFTSYGVIDWLHDLAAWGRLIAASLRPGGFFYLVEFHPLLHVLADDGRSVAWPYRDGGAIETHESGSYADADAEVGLPSYVWHHGLGDLVTALLDAGLRLDWLREHDESPYDCFPFTEESAPGRYVVAGGMRLPMLVSLRASA